MAFDIDALVEAAADKETFDVLAFVRGAKSPSDDVVVYTDADAALKLARIFVAEAANQQLAASNSLSLDDEYETADEDEISALHERLVASALTFHMQGLAPSATAALEKHIKATTDYSEGGENTEYNSLFNNTLIGKSIITVTNAAGAVQEGNWTPEAVQTLNTSLYVSESNKLFEGAAELNYVGAIFDRAVSADFS